MRPYLRVANVYEARIDTRDVLEMNFTPAEFERYKLKPGDVLLNEGQSRELVGRPAIYRDEVPGACFQNTLVRFSAADWVVPEFALIVFRHYLHNGVFQSIASWTTNIAHLGAGRFSELDFPVAPVSEQRRICEWVDSYISRLDAAVVGLKRVQANLKRYRASVLKAAVEGRLVPTEAELAKAEGRRFEPASELLTRILKERRARWEAAELASMQAKGKRPKDDKWKSKYQEPTAPNTKGLPELPEGWCWATVDQLGKVGTGATPKRGNSTYWSEGDIPWVTSGLVNQPLVDRVSEYVTDAALRETNLTLYPVGTILVAMYGEGKTRGKAATLAIEATTNQALAAIVLDDESKAVRPWMLLVLEHNYEQMRRISSGGVQPNLNLNLIRSIAIPLPPLPEQKRIADTGAAHLSREAHDLLMIERSFTRCTRLRQSILKWAFEGKLVDQDPNDEPASALLERIRAERDATAPVKKRLDPKTTKKSKQPPAAHAAPKPRRVKQAIR